jgi:hypothetical protein
VLYDPAAFEPLTDEPWDEARVRDGIAAIVADTDAAFALGELWPAHEWDGYNAALPLKNLYVGAAGVVWALDDLRRRGLAETTLDLPAAALRALERWRAEPDNMEGEPLPDPPESGLLTGEAGILLVACRLGHPLDDDLKSRIRANLANSAEDLMWGTPGTVIAAVAMGWDDLARESADALASRRDADALWTQRLWDTSFRGIGTVHGLAGNVRALLQVDDPRNETLRAESAAALARAATREDGLANWSSEGKLQWCASAPRASSRPHGTTSTRSSCSPVPSSSGGQARPATRRGTASATAPRGTALLCSPRSSGRRTSSGSSEHAALPSTPFRRPRACQCAIRSSRAVQAPRSSRRPASTQTRATRCSSAARIAQRWTNASSATRSS